MRKITPFITDLSHGTFVIGRENYHKITKITSKIHTDKKNQKFLDFITDSNKRKSPHVYLCDNCDNSIKLYLYILIIRCDKSVINL